MNARDADLASVIALARDHAQADFYRTHWKGGADFDALPLVSRAQLSATPLSRRKYKGAISMLRILDAPEGSFTVAWDYDDIREEGYGIVSARPMVCFADPYETVEKGIWCLMNGMTHLGGERNIDIAVATGLKFKSDSLITDSATLLKLTPLLQALEKPMQCISIVDSTFDIAALQGCAGLAQRTRLVLAQPESGAIAEAEFSKSPEFEIRPDCIVEHVAGALVITKVRRLMTPIIRYATGIRAQAAQGDPQRLILSN